jgi:hypothetical protein
MDLGGHAEIFDAELAELMMAANRAASSSQEHHEVSSIHIFSDCTSALTAILDPKPGAGQHYSANFCETINRFLTSNPTAKVTMSWCPSHSGIPGNERADELAKKATELAHNAPAGVSCTMPSGVQNYRSRSSGSGNGASLLSLATLQLRTAIPHHLDPRATSSA